MIFFFWTTGFPGSNNLCWACLGSGNNKQNKNKQFVWNKPECWQNHQHHVQQGYLQPHDYHIYHTNISSFLSLCIVHFRNCIFSSANQRWYQSRNNWNLSPVVQVRSPLSRSRLTPLKGRGIYIHPQVQVQNCPSHYFYKFNICISSDTTSLFL